MKKNKYNLRADGLREKAVCYKKQRKHFYGHTDAEIDKKIAAWKDSIDNPKGRPFSKVAAQYWAEKEPELSINSYGNYKVAVNRAVDYFGDIAVEDITVQMVIQYLKVFSAQGYSQKVINNSKGVLKGILDVAIVSGEIDHNPCVDLPLIKGKKGVMREPASEDDIKNVEAHKTDSMAARMYYFMLYTGCRLGEAEAIQQKDIDRQNHTAFIHQSLAYGGGQTPTLKKPKTDAGTRTIVLLDNVLEILPEGPPEQYVFFPEGFPTRGKIETAMRQFRRDANVNASPHQLRHSFASLLHSAGIDVKDAAEILGHSDTHLTQNLYTHLERVQRDAVDKKLNDFVKENRLK